MTNGDALSLNKITDILLGIHEKRKSEDIFRSKASDYDIVDFEKRFETSVVFHLSSLPESLSANMRVLKYWSDLQKSEVLSRRKEQIIGANVQSERKNDGSKIGVSGKELGSPKSQDFSTEKIQELIKTYRQTMLDQEETLPKSKPTGKRNSRYAQQDSEEELNLEHQKRDIKMSQEKGAESRRGGFEREARNSSDQFSEEHNYSVRFQPDYFYKNAHEDSMKDGNSGSKSKYVNREDIQKYLNSSSDNFENRSPKYSNHQTKRFGKSPDQNHPNCNDDLEAQILGIINNAKTKRQKFSIESYHDQNSQNFEAFDKRQMSMEYRELRSYANMIEDDFEVLKQEFRINLEKIRSQKSQNQIMKSKQHELEQEVARLTEENKQLNQESQESESANYKKNQYLENSLKEALESNEILEEQLEKLKSETKDIFLTSSHSKELILALQRENCELKQALDNMNCEVQQLLQTLDAQNKDQDTLKQEQRTLKMNADDLQSKLDEYETLFRENDADFAIDLQIIEKLQTETRQLAAELQSEQDAKGKLLVEFTNLKEEVTRAEIEQQANIHEMAQRISELEEEKQDLHSSEAELRSVLLKLEEENESLAIKTRRQKKKLKYYQKQYSGLEKQVELILSKNVADQFAELVFAPKNQTLKSNLNLQMKAQMAKNPKIEQTEDDTDQESSDSGS